MKIQHKIIAVPLVVMLLVGAVGIFSIESYLEKQLLERSKNELQQLAAAALEAIKTVEIIEATEVADQQHMLQSFQNLAWGLARATNVRITYTDANGQVLGDSDILFEQLKHLDNHKDRPEIQTALTSGSGSSQRYSNSVNTDMLYVAVRSNEEHYTSETSHLAHPLIARASRSQAVVGAAIGQLRKTLLSMSLLGLLAVLVLSLFGARMLTSAVRREQQLLEKRVESRTTEISILQTFGGLLNACSNLAEAGEVMINVIPKLLPGIKGGVSIIKSSRNRLDLIAEWGGEWPGTDKFLPTDCWALPKGHQHVSSTHNIQILCNHWSDIRQQQTLCIPLLAQGETIGVLHFVMENDDHLVNSADLWNAMAEQIGLTLANIQLRDSLREQAIRDPLTGLFNRRYMLEATDQVFSRVERVSGSIAVMMIDLDHFKRFNDNFGHDAGDHVLKAVATVLKESTRQEDIDCRYGGEEFCIICPFTEQQHALLVAERISKSIRSLELSMNHLSLGTVTASIGIALYPNHSDTMEGVLKAADEALYQAKEAGRDRVVISELVAAPKSMVIESDTPAEKVADAEDA